MGPELKAALKRAVKRALARGAPDVPPPAARSLILTYHSVGARSHEMNVSPGQFARQMAWLAANAAPIPLAQAAQAQPGAAVTFDDGYRDNLTHAAPILAQHAIPATIFVVPDRVGGRLAHDAERAHAELLSWAEIRRLHEAGFEIGAHTLTHRRLAQLDEAAQRAEIVGSAQRIADQLGQAPTAFAYPFGAASDYTAASMALVREAGFQYAVSNRYGPNPPGADRWQLRRIWIDATDDLAMFRAKVQGRLDALTWLDGRWGERARRALNRALGTD